MVGITPALLLCIDWMRYVVYILFVICMLGIRSAVVTPSRDTKEARVSVSNWLFGFKGKRMTYINLARVLELVVPLVNFGSAGVDLANSVIISVNYRVQIIFDVLLVSLCSLQGFRAYVLEGKTYGRKDEKRLIKMRRVFTMTSFDFDVLLEDVNEYDLDEGIHVDIGDDSETLRCEITEESMHYDKVFQRSPGDCITL